MFELLYDKIADPRTLLAVLIGVITVASMISIGLPYLEGDNLEHRMKTVAVERERIRAREREKLMAKKGAPNLRQTPKAYMKQIVERYSLSKWLGTDEAKNQLAMAGYRGPQAEVGFLFFRLVTPLAVTIVGGVYCFIILTDLSTMQRLSIALALAYVGLKGPELYLRNTIAKRQHSMRRAFPDAMDLLLICVESGMSIEHAFRRVSQEIGARSIPLAEEFTLTTAELSYLPDRRAAYDNFVRRTGLAEVKNIVTSLIQAEKYGTPLGAALRVVSQEARDNRMMAAEKKAASLPPKLTVPMIIFFLPVLFAVVLTPAIIQMSATNH